MSEIKAKTLFRNPLDQMIHILYEMTKSVSVLYEDGERERLDALNADFNTILTEYKEVKDNE